jgi:hypothetical protein
LKGSPRHVVAAAIKLQTQSFARQQYQARYPGTLCIVIVGGQGGNAMVWGSNAGDLQHGQMSFLGVPGPRGRTLWFTLVPDGVAKVTLDFPASQGDVTLPVANNGWGTLQGNLHSLKRTVWRSADGAAIRTITH